MSRIDDDKVRNGPENAHSNLVLSGDFRSPEHVLSADHLTADQKRAVFDQWLRDLRQISEDSPVLRSLRDSIEQAIARI